MAGRNLCVPGSLSSLLFQLIVEPGRREKLAGSQAGKQGVEVSALGLSAGAVHNDATVRPEVQVLVT